MSRVKDAGITQKFFPAELLFFCVLAFSRFFDHKLQKHEAVFPFMGSYEAALGIMLLYLALFFGFCVLAFRRSGQALEREMGYLTAFLAVFMVPFFLHKNYFGTTDTLILLLVLAVVLVVVGSKRKGQEEIGSIDSCPVSGSRRMEAAVLIVLLVSCISLAVFLGFIKSDVQTLLSGSKFLILLLFLSPYGYAAIRFFVRLCGGRAGRQRLLYMFYGAGAAIPAVLWIVAGDYSRAVFYGFVCYTLPAVCFAALGDQFFIDCLVEEKRKIRKILPIPAVFVFYPLIFVTFWMMGWESIPVEEILELQ